MPHICFFWPDIGYAASGSCIEEVNITSFAAHKIYIFYTDVHFIYMQGVGPSTKKSIQKAHLLKKHLLYWTLLTCPSIPDDT